MVSLLKEILIKNSKIFHCLQFSNNTIFEVQFEKFQKKELEVISLLKGGTRGIDAAIKNPKNFSHKFQFFNSTIWKISKLFLPTRKGSRSGSFYSKNFKNFSQISTMFLIFPIIYNSRNFKTFFFLSNKKKKLKFLYSKNSKNILHCALNFSNNT